MINRAMELCGQLDCAFNNAGIYGERCLGFKQGNKVRLLSRNKKNLNIHYPELVDALEEQVPSRFIVDGEVVAFSGALTDFSKLQDRMHVNSAEKARETGIAVYYYIFDLIYFEGYDLTGLELRNRKNLLSKVLTFKDPLRFTVHRNQEGKAYHNEACRKGWESIVAKDASSSYVHTRSRKWLKFKCVNRQEFVIGGFTEWTRKNRPPPPRFLGLRQDKEPEEVRRETPK